MSIKALFTQKPLISNQHGALAMAVVPFLYGIFSGHFTVLHIWLGLSWLFLYLFSYPFLALFNRNNKAKYQKWALIYFSLSVIAGLPVIFAMPAMLQFILPILPLAGIQIYYAKQKDERHIVNDIAGFLIFGVIGMASHYLTTQHYAFSILLHPTLFFIATTFYVKSVARERKNPRYVQYSLIIHLLFGLAYLTAAAHSLAFVYLLALLRAVIFPRLHFTIKQIGLWEFPLLILFLMALYPFNA